MARLPSGTEILKAHVSSAHRISGTASDWRYAIPGGQELVCEPGSRFSVADFTCHHAWYNVTANNAKVYVRRRTSNTTPLQYEDVSVSVTPGNYTSTTLIQTVASLLSAVTLISACAGGGRGAGTSLLVRDGRSGVFQHLQPCG